MTRAGRSRRGAAGPAGAEPAAVAAPGAAGPGPVAEPAAGNRRPAGPWKWIPLGAGSQVDPLPEASLGRWPKARAKARLKPSTDS